MKRLLLTLACLLVLAGGLSGTAYSDIQSTNVSAGMEIDYQNNPALVDKVQTDSGATSASVNFTGPNTGAQVNFSVNLLPLSTEAVQVNFDYGMHGNGYGITNNPGATGYLGSAYYDSNKNHAEIFYDAVNGPTQVTLTWNFTNIGPTPSSLVGIDGWSIWDKPGGFYMPFSDSAAGTFSGTQTITLSQGIHDLYVVFGPNVGGTIGQIDCERLGYVSFDFQPQVVPAPATLLLLGSGLVGLVGFRRKFKKS